MEEKAASMAARENQLFGVLGFSSNFFITPILEKRLRTVSEGIAPCPSQYRALSSSMAISAGSCLGSYVPMFSMKRPSRG